MAILTSQKQIVEASTADLIETYNALLGKDIKRFSSRAAGEVQVANAILAGEDNAAHAGVPKGVKPVAAPPGASKKKAAAPEDEAAKPAAKTNGATRPVRKGRLKAELAEDAAAAADPAPAAASITDPCPLCEAPAAAQQPAGRPGTVAGDGRRLCNGCNREYWIATGKEHARRKPGRDASAKAVSLSWGNPTVRAARAQKDRVKVGDKEYRSTAEAFRELKLPLSRCIRFRMELKAAGSGTFTHEGSNHKFTLVKAG